MVRARHILTADTRRGVILLVVLALLTLFAIVGISFVLYADAELKSSEIARDAETLRNAGTGSNASFNLLNYFLGQLLYEPDNQAGLFSALRGQSLGRSAFGYNDVTQVNVFPFNGTGRIHSTTTTPIPGADDYTLINYTYFVNDGFIRDPEHLGSRPNNTSPYGASNAYYGANVPYTYPDLNNLFLAAMKADGTVLTQSFHRPWLFGPMYDPANPTNPQNNPNWTSAAGKYLTLRPRPIDHTANFPYPVSPGGDVQNMVGGPGYFDPITNKYYKEDSIWMDLGYPEQVDAQGNKYKALFAALIIPIDDRVNVNIHGNILGNGQHRSNQGWGPWTVNLGPVGGQPLGVLADQNYPNEWAQIFLGNAQATPKLAGRYGPDQMPGSAGLNIASPFLPTPHFYSVIDYDGRNDDGSVTAQLNPVGNAPASSFPAFPPGYGNGSITELTNHPSVYNVYQPTGDDRQFAPSNMDALLRYGDTGASNVASDLLKLCPMNLYADQNDPAGPVASARRRRLISTMGFDLDRPGLVPWMWQSPGWAYNLTPTAGNPLVQYPQGGPIPFSPPGTQAAATTNPFAPPPSDFWNAANNLDWRAITAALGRLDLNRPLPEYPQLTNGVYTDLAGFAAAQTARQQLAADIFAVLLKTTTGLSPNQLPAPPPQPGPPTQAYNAYRWLAQLAVNMVDFIDDDDNITPFPWNPQGPTELVFGTELPRVVINEAYVEWTPIPNTPPPSPPPPPTATGVNVWVELYNAFNSDPSLTPGGQNGGAAVLQTQAGPVYQLVFCKPDQNNYLRQADNVWGTPGPYGTNPDPQLVYQVNVSPPNPPPPMPTPAGVYNWATPQNPTPSIPPSNGQAGPSAAYWLVGPGQLAGQGTPPPPTPNTLNTNTASVNVPGVGPTPFEYVIPSQSTTTPPNGVPAPTVLLQRLACPYLAPNQSPTNPAQPANPSQPYNPWITVDYMQNVNADPTINPPPPQPMVRQQNATFTLPLANPPATNPPQNRVSQGRKIPYAGYSALNSPYIQNQQGSSQTQPQTTFGQANTGAQAPFPWLVHFDRPLTSPMDLLHVSAFKPHELTQEFLDPTNTAMQPFGHRVPWFDEDLANPPGGGSHLLYRFFEFVETRSRASGLQAASTLSKQAISGPPATWPINPTPATVTPVSMTGMTGSGMPIAIQPGMTVSIIDPGSALPSENVVVTGVQPAPPQTPTTFTANFLKSHPAGAQIVLTSTGDRVAGKININNIWDPETLLALADPQQSNNFTLNDIYNPAQGAPSIFAQLLATRTPSGFPSGTDQPFWGLATGLYPTTDTQFPAYGTAPNQSPYGINNTLLRSVTGTGMGNTPRLFQVPFNDPNGNAPYPTGTPPYTKYQLLSKLFNNVTTRSNVFAVWLTVGYFQIADDTTRPMKLGAEVGAATGQNIRHRMFAIVDRSSMLTPLTSNIQTLFQSMNLNVPPTIPVTATALAQQVAAGTATAQVGQVQGIFSFSTPAPLRIWTWTLQPGTLITVDTGANQETVAVQAVTTGPPTIATMNPFTKNHAAGAPIVINYLPGMPGPQSNFNINGNSAVVPYYNLIN